LASSLLPSEFWWFALRRATDVSNYLPLKLNGKLTTPHELVYDNKPDMRNLIPLFSSVAYPEYKSASSLDTHLCRATLVGRSGKKYALEFYHPSTKRIITTATYKLDPRHTTAGPEFGLSYDGGLLF